MADVRGHGVISSGSEAFFVGTDGVDAIYLGEIQVWPAAFYGHEIVFLPDEGDDF